MKFFQRLRDERGAQSRLDDILDGETRNAVARHNLIELVRSTNRETEDVQIGGKKGKRLRVSVTKAAELGRLNDQIVVNTTSKKKPTITIPVFGIIEGDVMVLPPQVSFGVVRQGVGKTQHIRIQNRSVQPVSVVQVTSSLDSIVPKITEITPGKEYRLSLRVKGDSTPGKIRGSIEVVTDHPEEKHLSIPVYGMISGAAQASR